MSYEARLVVTETGHVRSPQLLRPLDPATDSAALESLCQWRFEPARRDGKPVAIRMQMTVSFALGG